MSDLITADGGLVVDARAARRVITRAGYRVEGVSPFGPCGVAFRVLHRRGLGGGYALGIIVSQADYDGDEWMHASLSRPARMPDYADLVMLKDAAFGPDRVAYQVFPKVERHISIHEFCLHLWGRTDGADLLPDFGAEETI